MKPKEERQKEHEEAFVSATTRAESAITPEQIAADRKAKGLDDDETSE